MISINTTQPFARFPAFQVNTRFLLYNSRRSRRDTPLLDVAFTNMTSIWHWAGKAFNVSAPTKVIVHGFGSSCSNVWVYEMRSALMDVVSLLYSSSEDVIVIVIFYRVCPTKKTQVPRTWNTIRTVWTKLVFRLAENTGNSENVKKKPIKLLLICNSETAKTHRSFCTCKIGGVITGAALDLEGFMDTICAHGNVEFCFEVHVIPLKRKKKIY